MRKFTLFKNLLWLALVFVAGNAMAQTNLLLNAGFEDWTDGKLTEWTPTTSAGGATLSQSTDAREGSYSVLVAGTSSNKRLAYKEITLNAGTYTFSFYAKAATEESGTVAPGYVPVTDGKVGTYKYGTYANNLSNTEWTLVSYEFTLSAETTLNLVIMNSKNPGKNVLIDDASLVTTDGGLAGGGDTPEPDEPTDLTGDGTKENPYTIADVMALNNPGEKYWVKGVIVGYIDGMSVNGATFDLSGDNISNTNLLLADEAGVNDVASCIPVQLTAGDVRTTLNLSDNPTNLGKELLIYGSLEKYFSVPGIKSPGDDYVLGEGGGDEPVDPDPDPDPEEPVLVGDGSAENPYTVADVITLDNTLTGNYWVKGVIVGYINGLDASDAVFDITTAESVATTNLLLADELGVTDVTKCVPVRLPDGDIRAALNLIDHPTNIGEYLLIYGSLEVYFNQPGVREPTRFALGENGEEPEVPGPEVPGMTGNGTQANSYTIADVIALDNPGEKYWVKGVIVGYIDGMSVSGATFDLSGETISNTNLLLADKAGVNDVTLCIPVQLPSGTVRTALNLRDNPDNLGKELLIYGSLEKYFSVAGLKSPTEYVLEGGDEPVEPDPTETYSYKKATTIESGKTYLLVAEVDGAYKVATPLSGNYGYLQVVDAKANGENITLATQADGFVLTATEGGYTIQASDSRYLYQTGTYNSFNVSADIEDGAVWTVESNGDGTFKITNTAVGKYIQYSTQYTSYGSYADEQGVMPCLYELVGGNAIANVAAESANAPVEVYTLGGVKVGNSLDGLNKGIYVVKQGNQVKKVIK